MGYFITLIAKYYYSDDKSIEQLSNIIKRKILEFDLENYQEYRYHNKIITVCDGLFNGNIERTFKEREYIPIYESEINFLCFWKHHGTYHVHCEIDYITGLQNMDNF